MDNEEHKHLITRRKLIRLGLLVTGGIAINGLDGCKPKKQVEKDPGKKQVTKSNHKKRPSRAPGRKFPCRRDGAAGRRAAGLPR